MDEIYQWKYNESRYSRSEVLSVPAERTKPVVERIKK